MADVKNKFIMEQSNFLKIAFTRVLKTIFADDSIPEQYRYSPGREGRQMSIFRVFPKRTEMLPCIVVETDTADVSIKQLGAEIVGEEYVQEDIGSPKVLDARIYGGVAWIPVRLTVVAETTTDREIITDIVAGYTRFAAKNAFALRSIEYLDIRSTEGDEQIEGKTAFTGTVEIKCQTEYKCRIDMGIYDKIMKLAIDLNFKPAGVE